MAKFREDFLIVSDLHIEEYSKFAQVHPNGMNSRLFWSVDILDQIFEYGEAHGIKTLAIGGDVFHKRGVISVAAYDATFNKLLKLLNAGWFVFSIVGNHDQATKSGEINALRPMPMTVVDFSEIIELPGGTRAGCISFCETPSKFLNELEKISKEKPDFYLIHQGVNSALIAGDEILSRHETNREDIRSITGQDPWIFSGHYHIQQHIDERFVYVGSATPMDFSDTTPKGFLHFSKEGVKQIESRAPKFVTLDTTGPEGCDLEKDPIGNYVRVIYEGEEPEGLAVMGSLGWVATKSKVQREYERRSSIEPEQSPAVIFRQYLSDILKREDNSHLVAEDLLEGLNSILGGRNLEQSLGGHKLDIIELEIKNFMRFRYQHLEFENLRGLTLIEGENLDDPSATSNGAGKSSLLEAVKWCLFGTTARGLTGDEVVNFTAGVDCSVEMIIAVDERTLCRLRRYRKDKEHRNQFFFEVAVGEEWEDMRGKSDAETLEQMVKFLGIDEQTFDTTVFFGHGFTKSFAGLSDKEQKAVLENIIGVEYFNELLEAAKAKSKAIEEELRSAEIRQSFLRNRFEEENKSLVSLRRDSESFESRRQQSAESLEANIAEVKDFIDTVADTKEEAAKIQEIEKEITELSNSVKDGVARNREFEDLANKEIKAAEMRLSDLRLEKQNKTIVITSHRENIQRSEIRIDKLKESPLCPTCGQTVKAREGIEASIKEYEEIIQDAKENIDSINTELDLLKPKFDSAESDLKKYTRVLAKSRESLSKHNAALEKINSLELEKFKISRERQQIESTLSSRKRELNRLKDELKKVLEGENPLAPAIERASQSLLEIEKERGEISSRVGCIERELSIFKFWETAFSDKGSSAQPPIKSYLFDSIVPVLDELARQYSEVLTSGSIEVQFNTVTALKSGELRDRFSVSVINKHGAADYRGDSGGERRKVDLAIMFALHSLARIRSGSLINILCLDEILDSLDSEGCERVMVLLREMAKSIPIIFVITHNENLKMLFNNKIIIQKKDGVSSIFDYASLAE